MPNAALMSFSVALLYTFRLLQIAHAQSTQRTVWEWTNLPTTPTCSTLIGTTIISASTGPVTSIITGTPTPDSCATVTTYGVDVTWIVTTRAGVVAENTRYIPQVSATVLAVVEVPSAIAAPAQKEDIQIAWPPPSLLVTVDQRIRITLYNGLSSPPHNESITLHFHGIVQKNGYVSMDGPENVVQCGQQPSDPNGPFVYDFVASKSGTYWIHSHDPGQYPKGLRSPLIIQNLNENDLYMGDFTATISDWYSNFWKSEAAYMKSPKGEKGDQGIEIFPDASLFNDYLPGISTSQRSIVFKVDSTANKPYRIRFINMSALFQYFVQIVDHPVSIVEIDGISLKPSDPTLGFIIAPGQRLSVSLPRPEAIKTGSYAIIAVIDSSLNSRGGSHTWGCISYDNDNENECAAPSLALDVFHRYNASDNNDPFSNLARARPRLNNKVRVPWNDDTHTSVAYPWNFNERIFEPAASEAIPDRETLLDVKPGNVHWTTLVDIKVGDIKDEGNPSMFTGFGSMNSSLWIQPDFPGLITALKQDVDPNKLESYGPSYNNSIIVKTLNDVVWLIFETKRGDHPMHLHGHHFQVLYKGAEHEYAGVHPYTEAVAALNDPSRGPYHPTWLQFKDAVRTRGPSRPLTRDTIQAERYQLLIIAFVADNPGVWALHCHNDFHAKSGMFRQIIEAPTELRKRLGTWSKATTADGVYNFWPGASTTDRVAIDAWQRNVLQCAPPG